VQVKECRDLFHAVPAGSICRDDGLVAAVHHVFVGFYWLRVLPLLRAWDLVQVCITRYLALHILNEFVVSQVNLLIQGVPYGWLAFAAGDEVDELMDSPALFRVEG
jgi:hypothetical protein